MEIDGSLARNIDFEVADFGVHEESCSYRSDFEILINFEKVSCEMLVLSLRHVSFRFSGFVVVSPCLWGKLRFQKRLQGRFACQA